MLCPVLKRGMILPPDQCPAGPHYAALFPFFWVSSRALEDLWANGTRLVTGFVLLGFSSLPHLRTALHLVAPTWSPSAAAASSTCIGPRTRPRTASRQCRPSLRSAARWSPSPVCGPPADGAQGHLHACVWGSGGPFLGLGCSRCAPHPAGYGRPVTFCHPLRHSVTLSPAVRLCPGASASCSGFSAASMETCVTFS